MATNNQSTNYENMTVEQLHDELDRRGEKVSGRKNELIERLQSSDKSSGKEESSQYQDMTCEQLHDELEKRGEKVSGRKNELIERLKSSDQQKNSSRDANQGTASHSNQSSSTASYDDMTVEQLHDELERRGEKVSGRKDELIQRLKSSDQSSGKEESGDRYENMTVEQLHDELDRRGEKVSGRKAELIERLQSSDQQKNSSRPNQSQQRDNNNYDDMTVDQLRKELKQLGKKVGGTRDELIQRLQEGSSTTDSNNSQNQSTDSQYEQRTIEELEEELKQRGIKFTAQRKEELIKRLQEDDQTDGTKYSLMPVQKIQHELSQRGLDTSGKKEDMVKRLQENDNDSMTGKRSNIAERAGQSPAHKEARTASAN